ncbi:hypothetical protein Tco_1549675 [Tanacetum coccineum]
MVLMGEFSTVVGGVCRVYDFEVQAIMGGDGALMKFSLFLFVMAEALPILGSLAIHAHSNELNNQMKMWLSEDVGSEDAFAQDMNEHCYLRQSKDAVKLGLLRELLRHARDETHERQLALDIVDHS